MVDRFPNKRNWDLKSLLSGLLRPQDAPDEQTNAAEKWLSFSFRSKLQVIVQAEAAECGLACLAMIATYYGKYVDLADLRRNYPVSLKGTTLSHLVGIARELNLSSRAVRAELSDLSMLRLPCVLHWNLAHFVVLKRVDRDGVVIHDPSVGARRVSYSEVSESFSGVVLELWPSPEFRQQRADQKNQIKITSLIGKTVGLVPLMLQIFCLAVGIELLSLLLPLMTQWIIDYVIVAHDIDLLTTCALGFIIVISVHQALTAMRSWMVMYLGASFSIQWQANILSHLIRLPIDYFQKRHLGDIVSRFGSIDQIQNTVTTAFITAALDGVMSVATMSFMLIYSIQLSAIVAACVCLYALLRLATFSTLRGNTQQRIVFNAKQQTHFLETMRGIKAIKLFRREELRQMSWLGLLAQQTNAGLKMQRAQLIFQTANGFLAGLERILVLWLGAGLIIDGAFTVGALMAFMAYREHFDSRISSLTDRYFEFRMLRLYTSRLSDIVLTAPEKEESRVPLTQQADIDTTIELRDVCYRYANHEPLVLKGVTLTISPGESVAITGASGCGKSTLVNILLGIIRPTRGTVKIGGVDISHLGVRPLRELIGTVTQEDTLFAGSIADNICFFDRKPEQSKIEACARMAAVHDEIAAMPMGYRTMVGDMGTALSGGQKQRVLIARALYCAPRILIFDEATSHLDLKCENAVNKAIRSLKVTRIIVAHRPETILSADRVISLEGGQTQRPGRRMREQFVQRDDGQYGRPPAVDDNDEGEQWEEAENQRAVSDRDE